ncbi:hypothetical protein QE379_003444 [Sphingomonas sp. SORGH_AS 879]|nr:hypothetical protein [Sphingomonas sp. SORGH_AS_0879]
MIAMANRKLAETMVAMVPPLCPNASKSASVLAASATVVAAISTMAEWPIANHRPTAMGRWPSCISLRVTLSMAAM